MSNEELTIDGIVINIDAEENKRETEAMIRKTILSSKIEILKNGERIATDGPTGIETVFVSFQVKRRGTLDAEMELPESSKPKLSAGLVEKLSKLLSDGVDEDDILEAVNKLKKQRSVTDLNNNFPVPGRKERKTYSDAETNRLIQLIGSSLGNEHFDPNIWFNISHQMPGRDNISVKDRWDTLKKAAAKKPEYVGRDEIQRLAELYEKKRDEYKIAVAARNAEAVAKKKGK